MVRAAGAIYWHSSFPKPRRKRRRAQAYRPRPLLPTLPLGLVVPLVSLLGALTLLWVTVLVLARAVS